MAFTAASLLGRLTRLVVELLACTRKRVQGKKHNAVFICLATHTAAGFLMIQSFGLPAVANVPDRELNQWHERPVWVLRTLHFELLW